MKASNGEHVCDHIDCQWHPPLAVVRQIGTFEWGYCLGHAFLMTCEVCKTRRLFCSVTGCGEWQPVSERARDLIGRLFQELVEI